MSESDFRGAVDPVRLLISTMAALADSSGMPTTDVRYLQRFEGEGRIKVTIKCELAE